MLILLSDGVDTHSVLPMEQVFEMARKSNALIYWIRIARDSADPESFEQKNLSSAWKNSAAYKEQMDTLNQIVNQSGGRILGVSSPSAIGAWRSARC